MDHAAPGEFETLVLRKCLIAVFPMDMLYDGSFEFKCFGDDEKHYSLSLTMETFLLVLQYAYPKVSEIEGQSAYICMWKTIDERWCMGFIVPPPTWCIDGEQEYHEEVNKGYIKMKELEETRYVGTKDWTFSHGVEVYQHYAKCKTRDMSNMELLSELSHTHSDEAVSGCDGARAVSDPCLAAESLSDQDEEEDEDEDEVQKKEFEWTFSFKHARAIMIKNVVSFPHGPEQFPEPAELFKVPLKSFYVDHLYTYPIPTMQSSIFQREVLSYLREQHELLGAKSEHIKAISTVVPFGLTSKFGRVPLRKLDGDDDSDDDGSDDESDTRSESGHGRFQGSFPSEEGECSWQEEQEKKKKKKKKDNYLVAKYFKKRHHIRMREAKYDLNVTRTSLMKSIDWFALDAEAQETSEPIIMLSRIIGKFNTRMDVFQQKLDLNMSPMEISAVNELRKMVYAGCEEKMCSGCPSDAYFRNFLAAWRNCCSEMAAGRTENLAVGDDVSRAFYKLKTVPRTVEQEEWQSEIRRLQQMKNRIYEEWRIDKLMIPVMPASERSVVRLRTTTFIRDLDFAPFDEKKLPGIGDVREDEMDNFDAMMGRAHVKQTIDDITISLSLKDVSGFAAYIRLCPYSVFNLDAPMPLHVIGVGAAGKGKSHCLNVAKVTGLPNLFSSQSEIPSPKFLTSTNLTLNMAVCVYEEADQCVISQDDKRYIDQARRMKQIMSALSYDYSFLSQNKDDKVAPKDARVQMNLHKHIGYSYAMASNFPIPPETALSDRIYQESVFVGPGEYDQEMGVRNGLDQWVAIQELLKTNKAFASRFHGCRKTMQMIQMCALNYLIYETARCGSTECYYTDSIMNLFALKFRCHLHDVMPSSRSGLRVLKCRIYQMVSYIALERVVEELFLFKKSKYALMVAAGEEIDWIRFYNDVKLRWYATTQDVLFAFTVNYSDHVSEEQKYVAKYILEKLKLPDKVWVSGGGIDIAELLNYSLKKCHIRPCYKDDEMTEIDPNYIIYTPNTSADDMMTDICATLQETLGATKDQVWNVFRVMKTTYRGGKNNYRPVTVPSQVKRQDTARSGYGMGIGVGMANGSVSSTAAAADAGRGYGSAIVDAGDRSGAARSPSSSGTLLQTVGEVTFPIMSSYTHHNKALFQKTPHSGSMASVEEMHGKAYVKINVHCLEDFRKVAKRETFDIFLECFADVATTLQTMDKKYCAYNPKGYTVDFKLRNRWNAHKTAPTCHRFFNGVVRDSLWENDLRSIAGPITHHSGVGPWADKIWDCVSKKKIITFHGDLDDWNKMLHFERIGATYEEIAEMYSDRDKLFAADSDSMSDE